MSVLSPARETTAPQTAGGVPRRILTIAWLTFHEARRRKVLYAALGLGALFLLAFGFGLYNLLKFEPPENQLVLAEASNFLTLAGLYVVNFLMVMMTVLTSVDALSGEINSGTIQTLATKPLRRWEIVVGKWLGFAAMLLVYLMVLAGGILLEVRVLTGYAPPNMLAALGLMALNVLLLLAVALAASSRLSTLASGTLLFGLYGVTFVASWIEQIGTLLQNQTAINIGIVASLLLPSEALWRRAAHELSSLLGALEFSPFAALSVPSPAMVVYAVIYTAAMLALAIRLFTTRDL